ncbi:universal stress protein [Sinirhodobacter populi]|nr:universal stress protein [Sinirhodobacter populi]
MMKLLVGYTADKGGREALALAATLARSSGGRLIVVTVHPEGWDHPSPARVDAEYAQFLEKHAAKTLASARAGLPEGIEAEFLSRTASLAGKGLRDAAEEFDVDGVVLGSARTAVLGRFAEGTTATEILHSSTRPVILAPRGYTAAEGARISRITCTVTAANDASGVISEARIFATAFKVPLRLASFIVRDKQMYPTGAGYDAENLVSNQLRAQAQAVQDGIRDAWKDGAAPESVLGDGPTWKAAIDSIGWLENELIVIGSSHLGPFLRVFLGSNSGKIARFAPVPRIVIPRPAG